MEEKKSKRGGLRVGAGRPKGTVKNTGKNYYFPKAITLEEKEFLEKCLKEFREGKNKA